MSSELVNAEYEISRSEISIIIQGLVLGLLLYPIALKYILQICEWSINTTSAEARRYYEIGRSLIFVASLGIVLIVIVPSWMQFVHKFQMHPFLWYLINILI
ncbi:Dolichol kinase EVAN [Glycine soja]|nr:Dolichol kinase EVAN [Glycine max]